MRVRHFAFGLALLSLAPIALLLRAICADQTVYAPGFEQASFDQVNEGMSRDEVYQLLGPPISEEQVHRPEIWVYGAAGTVTEPPTVVFEGEAVRHVGGEIQITRGMAKEDVVAKIGEPTEVHPATRFWVLHYSAPQEYGRYEAKIIRVDSSGRVLKKTEFSSVD